MPGLIARIVMKQMMKQKLAASPRAPRDYSAAREELRRQSALQPLPGSVRRTKTSYGGVPAFWYEDGKRGREKLVLYLHGGGFNSGSAEHSYNLPVALCRKGGFPVLSVEYRLAPEHPYPAGLEDCAAVYQALLDDGYRGADIALAGDSAGGNLVFALALYLRDREIDLPAALCALSPVGALDDTPPSRTQRESRDCIIGEDFTQEMADTYVRGRDVREPYLSPIYGSFAGLPPIWMCVGTEEVFYDDAFLLRAAAEKAGVSVSLMVGEGMGHVYPLIPDRISREAIAGLRAFLAHRLTGVSGHKD